MQTSEHSAEQLHQQASAHYLQGKFAEALAVWRQILAADPEDERAREGLRLCELLTEDGAIEADAVVAEEAAPAEAPPSPQAEVEADAPIEFEVPELELDLPSLDALAATEPAAADSRGQGVETPDPNRQRDGIELGDEPEPLEIAGEVPPAPAEIVEAIPDVPPGAEAAEAVDMAIPDADVEFAPAAGGDAAEAELKKRVQDLMNEALAAYQAGDSDGAHGVLARVFILDETHAEALELQELIEGGVPSPTEHVDVADLDAPEHSAAPGEFDLMSDAPEADGLAVAEAPLESPAFDGAPDLDLPDVPAPAAAVAAEAEPVETDALQLGTIETVPGESVVDDPDDSLESPEDDDIVEGLAEELAEEPVVAAPSKGKRIQLPQFDNSRMKRIGLVAAVLIVAVVGVGFWMKLKGTQIRDEPTPLPALQAEADAGGAEAEPREGATATDEAPVVMDSGAAASATPVDVASAMADGREAMSDGDYAAAMVAFHAVLEEDPTHLEANERLQAATDGYKRQQEAEKQWLAAAALFRDGEYRSSMKMFYRIEPGNEGDAERLERYRRNGWYNMAVLALRAGHCDLARSHLAEAEQIDADDADVATAQALADSCDAGSRRTGYQRAIQVISLRGLDD